MFCPPSGKSANTHEVNVMAAVKNCRICESTDLYFFLNLGSTPLVNNFVKVGHENDSEPVYPLEVCMCKNCGLVQLGYVVPPETLFRNYIYFSSTSVTMREHFAEYAKEVLDNYASKGDLIVEIASNDGVLLKNMLGKGVHPLGVEPATNIAEVARSIGVETLNDFFNSQTAEKICASRGMAKVIIANNVFAHIPEINDCVKGMKALLSPDGAIIMEFPHLYDLYQHLEFDTIYHEHLSYFSLKPLIHLFSKYDMELFDAKKLWVHGGTLRVYVQKKGGPHKVNSDAIKHLVSNEERMGLYSPEAYDKFAKDVANLRTELVAFLTKLKNDGKKIAIYGAPAKGNTLLNYCKIGTDLIDYAVDKSPAKQGLLTPGMHIRVYGPEKLRTDRPDYLLILAWNFRDEIIAQQSEFSKAGGKFIIPLPKPYVV